MSSLLTAENKFIYLKELLEPLFSKIVTAIILLLIGFTLAKLTTRLAQKILAEFELNELVKNAVNKRIRVEQGISGIIGGAVYVITVMTVLEILGLSSIIIQILTVGVLVIIIAIAVLVVKDFIPNMIASFVLHRREHIDIGTEIELENVTGIIKEMNFSDVQIETESGDLIHIPNALFMKKTFKTKAKKRENI